MRPRAQARRRADVVSVVAGEKTPEATRVVAAFRRGVARALPRAKVLVEYSNEMVDPTACERIANAQIDAGSDVVFVHSGRCGTGALAVARTRGVWAISGDGVGEPAGGVLGAIFKDWDNAVYTAVAAFAEGTLPAGDVVLGLDGYNVGLDMVIAGSTRCSSAPLPDTGSQPSLIAKNNMRIGPRAKLGNESPNRLTKLNRRSSQEFLRNAERTPAGIESAMATSRDAMVSRKIGRASCRERV